MMLSHYLVEAALYAGFLGFAILILSCVMGFGGLLMYLIFGW